MESWRCVPTYDPPEKSKSALDVPRDDHAPDHRQHARLHISSITSRPRRRGVHHSLRHGAGPSLASPRRTASRHLRASPHPALHQHVPPRRVAAHPGKHVVLVDLRRPGRRPLGPLHLLSVLLDMWPRLRSRPAGFLLGLKNPRHRSQRSDRRRLGRVHSVLPVLAHPDPGSFVHYLVHRPNSGSRFHRPLVPDSIPKRNQLSKRRLYGRSSVVGPRRRIPPRRLNCTVLPGLCPPRSIPLLNGLQWAAAFAAGRPPRRL